MGRRESGGRGREKDAVLFLSINYIFPEAVWSENHPFNMQISHSSDTAVIKVLTNNGVAA